MSNILAGGKASSDCVSLHRGVSIWRQNFGRIWRDVYNDMMDSMTGTATTRVGDRVRGLYRIQFQPLHYMKCFHVLLFVLDHDLLFFRRSRAFAPLRLLNLGLPRLAT